MNRIAHISSFPYSPGEKIFRNKWGGNKSIIETIEKCLPIAVSQTKNIAQQFKGNSVEQTCKNIWSFLKSNIVYEADEENTQPIKLPSALLSSKIGDCKSLALFSSGICKNLKIPFVIRYINQSREFGNTPRHVYNACYDTNGNEIILDAVHWRFNASPPNIYYQKDYNYNTMDVYGIAGINSDRELTLGAFLQQKINGIYGEADMPWDEGYTSSDAVGEGSDYARAGASGGADVSADYNIVKRWYHRIVDDKVNNTDDPSKPAWDYKGGSMLQSDPNYAKPFTFYDYLEKGIAAQPITWKKGDYITLKKKVYDDYLSWKDWNLKAEEVDNFLKTFNAMYGLNKVSGALYNSYADHDWNKVNARFMDMVAGLKRNNWNFDTAGFKTWLAGLNLGKPNQPKESSQGTTSGGFDWTGNNVFAGRNVPGLHTKVPHGLKAGDLVEITSDVPSYSGVKKVLQNTSDDGVEKNMFLIDENWNGNGTGIFKLKSGSGSGSGSGSDDTGKFFKDTGSTQMIAYGGLTLAIIAGLVWWSNK